jgi:uncharacterized membrane protein
MVKRYLADLWEKWGFDLIRPVTRRNRMFDLSLPALKTKMRGRLAPSLLVILMIADFWLLAGLALQRHDTFNSNALDLGYHDQVIWNTLHGRPYRLTLYRQDEQGQFPVDVPLDQIRDRDSLLSYHVEPLLALIAPIYWLWDDVRVLLLLQAGALTLGAWWAYRLGRRRLGHPWAGLAIALLYLLAPARQAAALSDFHTVAITAPLFLLAFDALDSGRPFLFLLASLLCLIGREDTAIIVIALAVYAAVFQRRLRRPALILTGVSLLYLYLATRVIMPYYSGLAGPTYLYRYTQFGANWREMARNLFSQPQLYWNWLRQPVISAYLGGLLATGGVVALAAPEILAIVLPVVVLNALSNTGWPSSGGAHYSVVLVPFLVVAAAVGMTRLGQWTTAIIGKWGRKGQQSTVEERPLLHASSLSLLPAFPVANLPARGSVALFVILALAVALRFQVEEGVAPFSQRWSWAAPNTHDLLGAKILEMVPAEVPVSAQSPLYPHLSHRQGIYQFPTIADAEYIVLDVTNRPAPLDYPSYFQHVQSALTAPNFGPLAAADGYLVLQRGAQSQSFPAEEFLSFTLAQPEEIGQPLQADFGDALRLEGYTLSVLPVVDQRGPYFQMTTFWRALRATPGNLRPIFYYARTDGAIVYQQTQLPFELYWRSTEAWQIGRLYKLTTPELQVTDNMAEALLAVAPVDSDPGSAAARLKVSPVPGSIRPDTVDSGTLMRLLELPR